ncbi:GlcG/HbpS family heme-binding protein [Sphingomonas bacterium]|uniref:GlcG/HbpS family heme-binding protein n=1 Tax=Sphingomonas bacterium TaxID=1895847 RepID=UPI0020C68EB6|nr:heme-binding protein [Sphingomonas bacterium]
MLAAAMSPASAQWDASKASGFPGDRGRMFGGLPFPTGPLPPRPAETPVSPALPMDVALVAARAATAACAGYHVGVAIVDLAGMPKLYFIADGTAGNHAYTAFRKAFTALTFRQPSEQVGEATKTDARLRDRVVADGNLLTFAGGLPIVMNGRLVGAIGVSGAEPSAVDERCAVAALRRIGATPTD